MPRNLLNNNVTKVHVEDYLMLYVRTMIQHHRMGGGRTRAYKRKQKTISLLFFVVATGYLLSFSKIDWREVL